jgi:hypothetical protein
VKQVIVINAEDGSELILGQEEDQLYFWHDGHGDPEPLAAGSSFYVRWVKFGKRKHIVCLGDDAGHPDVDRVSINTPYVKGTPAMLLPGGPTFNGRRLLMPVLEPFISGIVSAEWLAPRPRPVGGHETVHIVVTPPLEWGLRYPEDFPESLRM